MNKLEDMRLLHAVVKLGSFTQAAAHLGTTQSRVSRAVARLENELGVALLRRSSRSVAPTARGIRYAEFAQKTLAELAAVEAELKGEVPATRLRISSPPAVGRRLVAEPLAEFCSANPEITLDWSLGARRVDLISEEVDVAIRFAPLPQTWRRARTLLRGAFHIVAAPALITRPWSLSSLPETPTLGLHVTHLRDRWPVVVDGVADWLPVKPKVWCDDVEALIALSIAGVGATLLPDFLVVDELADQRLVRLTSAEQAMPAEVLAVTETQNATTAAGALVRHLSDRLRRYR